MFLLRFGGEDVHCLKAGLESEEGSAWLFIQPRQSLAKKFATKTTSVPHSYEQFGISSC